MIGSDEVYRLAAQTKKILEYISYTVLVPNKDAGGVAEEELKKQRAPVASSRTSGNSGSTPVRGRIVR